MIKLSMCVMVAIGCSGGGSSGSIPPDQAYEAVTGALCDREVRCGAISSRDFCVAEYTRLFQGQDLPASVAAGVVAYDGAKVAACLSAYPSISCDPSDASVRVTPAACKDAIRGTIPDGGACTTGSECISRSCTTSGCGSACCPGTCDPTPPSNVAIGGACTGTSQCATGAYCNTTTMQCAKLLAEGATCNADSECTYNTVCTGASAPRTCTATPKAGGACATVGSQSKCVVLGLGCDAATTTCAPLSDLAKTCDPTASLCKTDLLCDTTAHTCSAPPGSGQSCPRGLCSPDSYCPLSGSGTATCTAYKADGTACQSAVECDSDYCDSTTMACAQRPTCL